MNQTAQRWMRQPWFAALLLIALLFRALVPAGYMPGVGADGTFTVMLCPGYAPVPTPHEAMQMSADEMAAMPGMGHMAGLDDAAHHGGHDRHEGQATCPYAAASAGVALQCQASSNLLPQIVHLAIVLPPERQIPRGTIVPTSLPRGPPSLA